MSAIAGIYHMNHEEIHPERGDALMKQLRRYPADHIRDWRTQGAFLGCHAQWITPESVGEILPFHDRERGLAITADAIIDNRTELFEQLQVPREDRPVMPDSLLILLAYEKWGERCPRYLVGDFAFMIWNERKRSLFGARDFSGNRTLYLARSAQLFAFCTTIEPLFTLPGLDKSLNEHWVSEFLAIPMTADAIDCFATVYSHIQQLPPSHSLTIADGNISFTRYCTLEEENKLNYKSDREYEEAFRDVFNTAVLSRIRTHRQVGAHLSGGLDSGSVASFAAKALREKNKPLHTFSYYPLEDFVDFTPKSRVADERPLIQSTVNYVGNIKDNYLNFPELSPFSEIDDWLETMEMPYKFFENSFWLKGIYEQAYKQDIGVMLNGQRGNWTISWGPALDYQANLIKQFRWIRFYRELQQYSNSLGVKKSRVMSAVSKKAFPIYGRYTMQKSDYQLPMLINPQFARRTQVFEKLETYGLNNWGFPQSSAYAIREDQFKQLYFWNINGTIGTKLSLKYLMWDRDPTNDLRVIRFCLSVPDDQFVQNGVDRALIRRSTEGYLPDNVRLNQRIRGVQGADGVQRMTGTWDAFISELHQVIADPAVAEYLNTEQLAASLDKIGTEPRPELAFDFNYRILMRSLIFYRFIKKHS